MGMNYALVQRIIDGTGMILDTSPGSPDSGSYVTEAQVLEYVKGKILFDGYLYNGAFYKESGHLNIIPKVEGALYVDKSDPSNLALYICLSSTYTALTEEAAVSAIRTELLNGTLEPLISTKAKKDEDGNVIKTTYATKTELQEHIDAFNALGLSVVDGAINITFTE